MNKTPNNLTKKQNTFIQQLLETGGDVRKAAKNAGYTDKSALSIGYQMLRLPHVIEAYKELIWHKLATSAASSVNTINSLAVNAQSEYVQLNAAKDVLDRLGYKQQDVHTNVGKVVVSFDFGAKSDSNATQAIDAHPQVIDLQAQSD